MTGKLDRRLYAYRDDLADASLAGRVEAERLVEGQPYRVAVVGSKVISLSVSSQSGIEKVVSPASVSVPSTLLVSVSAPASIRDCSI